MSSYTNVFGGSTVQVSQVSYREFSFSENTTLNWPESNEDTTDVVARSMDVTATTSGLALLMPPANQVSTGMDTVIRNMGSYSFAVQDNDGNPIATIGVGQRWQIYVVDNTSVPGSWRVTQFGTGTSSADAASLAGLGLTPIGTTLNQSTVVTSHASDYTIIASDRASTQRSTGGAITFTLDTVANLTSGWFVQIKNSGTGSLTVAPSDAATIDGDSNLTLSPDDSCILVCDGINFYTIGFGQNLAQSGFTRLVKAITATSVTLTATEAGNVVQEYTGTLSGNSQVVMPTTVARYYVFNNTASGAYTLTVTTSGGSGVAIPYNTHLIVNCDGTNIVNSVGAGTGTVSQINAGTGLTGGPITTSGTLSIANTGVVSGSYLQANIAVNSQGQITTASNGVVTENQQTIDYVLQLSDAFGFVSENSGSATKITVPTNASAAFAVGTLIGLLQRGSGDMSVTSAGGVTLYSEGSKYKLFGQYAVAGLLKTGTNEWFFAGNRKS